MNTLYMILAAAAAAAAIIHYLLHRDSRARLTLANDINSGTHPDGIVTGTTDAALGRYRLVKQGASATTFAVAGASDTPIGITLDETANTTDLTAVRLLACGQGTVIAISDGSAAIARSSRSRRSCTRRSIRARASGGGRRAAILLRGAGRSGIVTAPMPGALATIEDRLLADPQFRGDPSLRRDRLGQLHDAMRDADCDPAFIVALKNQLLTTFGGPAVMARFRSSSNAEDAPGFSGAGLYESTNACLADDQDPDKSGPSRCDPAEPEERGLCRAVKKVWASLWLVRAYEEREWYGIDHAQAAMGILVDLRLGDERANMVVFTGDPNLPGDHRFLVNAQTGDLEVVSSDPGTSPEKTRLTLTAGEVTKIDKPAGRITLRHGEIRNLDMPAMTMVFRVADTRLLDVAKVGERVKFTADKRNGHFTVVTLERAD